jgi:anaerobic ribonucleoside-triphosphate reductase activating protein
MNILSTQYTLATKSLDIYVAGCKGQPHCKNCHNPESWCFDNGKPYIPFFHKHIKNKLIEFDIAIENIMVFGGEPLDQTYEDILTLLMRLSDYNKSIWLFTRYELNEVPEEIKGICDYIKCGRYREDLKCENNISYGIKLATSNQKVFKRGIDY